MMELHPTLRYSERGAPLVHYSVVIRNSNMMYLLTNTELEQKALSLQEERREKSTPSVYSSTSSSSSLSSLTSLLTFLVQSFFFFLRNSLLQAPFSSIYGGLGFHCPTSCVTAGSNIAVSLFSSHSRCTTEWLSRVMGSASEWAVW